MLGRIIAIGDIHGCLAALDALMVAINPRPDDTIITLGDYVDRGPNPSGVIDRLLAMQQRCQLVPLLGNHDQVMLWVCEGRCELFSDWRLSGGDFTLKSYGGCIPDAVPPGHLDFLRNCRLIYEVEHHFFVHCGYEADKPLDNQDRYVNLLWKLAQTSSPWPALLGEDCHRRTLSQKSGEILDLGYLKCIDTYCIGNGSLTALEVESDEFGRQTKRGSCDRTDENRVLHSWSYFIMAQTFHSYPTDLTDAQWEVVRQSLRPRRRGANRRTSMREVVNAVLYITRRDLAWRKLPQLSPLADRLRLLW